MYLRGRVVDELSEALADMGLHVRPFGSFLSSMGFPDSDVDLLLAGTWRGQAPYELPEAARKSLLRNVGGALRRQRAVDGQVRGAGAGRGGATLLACGSGAGGAGSGALAGRDSIQARAAGQGLEDVGKPGPHPPARSSTSCTRGSPCSSLSTPARALSAT